MMERERRQSNMKQITLCNLFALIFVSCLIVSLYAFLKVRSYEMLSVPVDVIKLVSSNNFTFDYFDDEVEMITVK